jgi:hypothetical protein
VSRVFYFPEVVMNAATNGELAVNDNQSGVSRDLPWYSSKHPFTHRQLSVGKNRIEIGHREINGKNVKT